MSSINLLDNNEKNELIKQFSRNFIQQLNSIRLSSLNNKKYFKSSNKSLRNKEKIDSTKNTDKTFLNSLFDDYFNISSKRNKNKSFKNIFTNKISRKKSYNNRSPLNKNNKFQTISSKFSNSLKELNNRMINITNKLLNKSKNKNKNTSKIKMEPFYQRLFEPKKYRQRSMNNLRAKFLARENSDISVHPKITKNSSFLIKKKYDKKALYQPSQMKEKNIEKNFSDFYTRTLKENISCSFIEKSLNNSLEKYNEFYQNNINWKKGIEQRIKNEKIKIEQNEKDIFNEFHFKPSLDKNSLIIAKKIEEFSMNKNNFYIHNKNDKDIKNRKRSLDKYKTNLKIIINNIYNDNTNNNKKKNKMKSTNTNINLYNKNMSSNKFHENKKIILKKTNYNLKVKNRKKEDNKIEENKNKKDINGNFNKINKYTYILQKKKKVRKKRNEKQREADIYSFYRINVNNECAWVKQTLNNIPFDKKYKKLIKKAIM